MGRRFAEAEKHKTLDKMINSRKDWLSGEGMAELEIKAGDKFFVPWPFSYFHNSEENTIVLGADFTSTRRSDGFPSETVYHVEGRSILTVIGVFEPPGYQTRIFYTRHYQPPAEIVDQISGTKQLRIKTLSFFKRMLGPSYLQLGRKASEQEILKAIAEIKAAIAKGPEDSRPFYEDDEIPF